MKAKDEKPSDALERVFHEPNRLAIMSTLCAENRPMVFKDLREACDLTAGNLNRHLKVLREAGVVEIDKSFVDDKPRTTITLSQTGLERFSDYLSALSKVLSDAKKALPKKQKSKVGVSLRNAVKA